MHTRFFARQMAATAACAILGGTAEAVRNYYAFYLPMVNSKQIDAGNYLYFVALTGLAAATYGMLGYFASGAYYQSHAQSQSLLLNEEPFTRRGPGVH